MTPRISLSVRLLEDRIAPAVYSIDGTGNNSQHPTWGSTGQDLLRIAPDGYADGISAVGGTNRPSARVISNTVSDQGDQDTTDSRLLSSMAYAWGQFIDHDMDLTPTGTEPLSIPIPAGDPFFDPNDTGTQTMDTTRSIYDPTTGTSTANPRQQVNVITSWLDGSMIYGSDAATAAALRTHSGGKLKTSAGNLLPIDNSATFPNGTITMANDAGLVPDDQLFAAGDVRANENSELTALQTLFVREHNYWATKTAQQHPGWTDEQIYQQARSIVIAEIQSITFNEWLPDLLGRNAVGQYQGYNANVNPETANEFSTAAFRFGHSMLSDDVEFLNNAGNQVAPTIPLADAFFYPPVIEQNGIDSLLKYLSSDPSQELDTKVVDSVRNFLFGPPGAGGLDLASLNIERGRDNGLADYNSTRVAYGLPAVTSFAQITSDPTLQAELQQLYGNVNNIDLWVGGLAEDHVPGGSLGPTFTRIIANQFQRLRTGDSLWYQRTMSGSMLQQINNTTLADIIRRDSGTVNLQQDVFFFKVGISGTVFADGNHNGHQDHDEPGLAGKTVTLIDLSDNSVVATTKTDFHGNYSFGVADGLGTGRFRVQVNGPVTTPPHVIAITAGDQFVQADIGLAVNPPPPPHGHGHNMDVFQGVELPPMNPMPGLDSQDASQLPAENEPPPGAGMV